jgi:hypothetical protein
MTEAFIQDLMRTSQRLTLIGMSGLGKSHWSEVLESNGYKRICCDDMIEARIRARIGISKNAVWDMGQWVGFPYNQTYRERENIYLAYEIDVLNETLDILRSTAATQKIVIDTTGSAPYAGDSIMRQLRSLTHVVHLAISKHHVAALLEKYIRHPRPVLWGDKYIRRPGEALEEALSRSYEALLHYREQIYRQYAHHSIPFESHRL